MNKDENAYLELMKDILENGDKTDDRTGTGVISKFGTHLRFSLKGNVLPALTTKKVFIRGAIEELLFFIRGDTDTKKLEAKGVNIWKGNTSREFLDSRGLKDLPEGSLGKGYGYQWRRFGEYEENIDNIIGIGVNIPHTFQGVDQLAQMLNTLKTNPSDRRMIISAWNPLQLDDMSLPPCHLLFQVYVANGELSLQWYQRSVDYFLGFSFNCVSYAMLAHILAKTSGLKAKELIFSGGNTHIYSNHIDQVKEQLSRKPLDFPTVNIKKDINTITDIENLCYEDFEIVGYKHHDAIKAPMAI